MVVCADLYLVRCEQRTQVRLAFFDPGGGGRTRTYSKGGWAAVSGKTFVTASMRRSTVALRPFCAKATPSGQGFELHGLDRLVALSGKGAL